MATNVPVSSELPEVGVKAVNNLLSMADNPSTHIRVNSNTGQSFGNKIIQGSVTQNTVGNASMSITDRSTNLGVTQSVVDLNMNPVPLVNTAPPRIVSNTLPGQNVVFLTLKPPQPCFQQLESTTGQNVFQTTPENKLVWVGNNAPSTSQPLQFQPQNIRVPAEGRCVPHVTPTLQHSLSRAPKGVTQTVKDQLLQVRNQPASHKSGDLLRNETFAKVSGSVSPSLNSSRPSQLGSPFEQKQQSSLFAKHVPNLLNNSRGAPSKHLPDASRKSGVTPQDSFSSKPKSENNQPVFLVNPISQSSSTTVKGSNIFYLVSGPNGPPTLVSPSLLGLSLLPGISNHQNYPSASSNVSPYRPGHAVPPHSFPTRSSNIPLMQVKREQEQDSVLQLNKNLKPTAPVISIKKEPEDDYVGASSITKPQIILQGPLPKHRLPAVSEQSRNNQVGTTGDSSSVSANTKLRNFITGSGTSTVRDIAVVPSSDKSETVVSSSHVTKNTIVTTSVEPGLRNENTLFSVRSPTISKQKLNNNTQNDPGKKTMKLFIVTDKSGTSRVVRVPSSTAASDLLNTLSEQLKGKRLQTRKDHQKGGNGPIVTSSVFIKTVTKVNGGAPKNQLVTLKSTETRSKPAADSQQVISKNDGVTYNMVDKDGGHVNLGTDQVMQKPDTKCYQEMTQKELKLRECKRAKGDNASTTSNPSKQKCDRRKRKKRECALGIAYGKPKRQKTRKGIKPPERKRAKGGNIVTKSILPKEKRDRHKRRKRKWALGILCRKPKPQTKFVAKVIGLDHNYSAKRKFCKSVSKDRIKSSVTDIAATASTETESCNEIRDFETQAMEYNHCALQDEKEKLSLPKVVLKPLKLKPMHHFQTIVLHKSPEIDIIQVKRGRRPTGNVLGDLVRSDQNSCTLNVKDCESQVCKEVSNMADVGEKSSLPQTIEESLVVSVKENVDEEPEVTIKCEDILSQTCDETPHSEEQPEEIVESPSDLSLMSSKDRVKILRERMKRREREIETLKSIKHESLL